MRLSYIIILCAISAHASKKDQEFHKKDLQSYLSEEKDNQEIERMDIDGDGKMDTFVVFEKEKGSRNLVMHLFDLNSDEKIDRVKHFKRGKQIRVESDLDFDEKVDSVSEYDPETGRLSRKLLSDGKSFIWKFWHRGELRRKEVDRNNDGEPDMWVHYRGGQKVKTEIDVDFTGKNIRVEKHK